MADEKTIPPEGGDNKPEGDVAKLKAELESVKAEAAKEKAERVKLESIRTELEETRQAAKEREKKALEEQGQFKELYEKALTELNEIKPKVAELEPFKTKYEETAAALKAREDAERSAILDVIPEGEEREKWKDAPIDILRNLAPLYSKEKPGTFNGGASHRSSPNLGAKPWKEMTMAERDTYTREHLNDPATLNKKIAGTI